MFHSLWIFLRFPGLNFINILCLLFLYGRGLLLARILPLIKPSFFFRSKPPPFFGYGFCLCFFLSRSFSDLRRCGKTVSSYTLDISLELLLFSPEYWNIGSGRYFPLFLYSEVRSHIEMRSLTPPFPPSLFLPPGLVGFSFPTPVNFFLCARVDYRRERPEGYVKTLSSPKFSFSVLTPPVLLFSWF